MENRQRVMSDGGAWEELEFESTHGWVTVNVTSFTREIDEEEPIYIKISNYESTAQARLSPEEAVKLGEHLVAVGEKRMGDG